MDINVNLKSKENRPTALLVVCILSWVNIGFTLVTSLYQMFSGPVSKAKLESSSADFRSAIAEMKASGYDSVADMMDKMMNMNVILNDHFYTVLFLTMVGLVIGMLGVSLMFLGRKLGFHLYIIYSIFTISQIYLFFSASEVPSLVTWLGISISAIFIALYARQLKWMQ